MITAGRIRVALLCLADALSIGLVWFFSVATYKLCGFGNYDMIGYFRVWPIVFIFLGINWVVRLYHGRGDSPAAPLAPVEEFRRLALSAVMTHALVMAFLGFHHRAADISRFVLLSSGVLLAIVAQPMRDVFRRMMFALRIGQIPAYVIGDGAAGVRIEQLFAKSPYFGFRIVRRFRADATHELIKESKISRVSHLFCCYKDDRFFRAQLAELSAAFNFIEYVPTVQQFPVSGSSAVGFGSLGGLEMVNQRRLRFLRLEKALLDKALSLLILILSLPLFALVPILIKSTSRGPVFYRPARLGQKGRLIHVWKFRSMYVDAEERLKKILAENPAAAEEWRENFKLRNDPRVTVLGRFLRKTSIDELPQLINVFTHEMALIGPRPIVPEEVRYYGKNYELVSSVKPGITGLWQASGRSNCDYDERVSLDVHYVLNWSPWMDLWIVLRTISSVLTMRGAV